MLIIHSDDFQSQNNDIFISSSGYDCMMATGAHMTKNNSEISDTDEGSEKKTKMDGFLEDIMFEIPRGQGGWDLSEVVYQVRSSTYLKGKKKTPSQATLFDFVGLQMVHMPEQIKSKKSKLSPTSASEGSSNSIHMALQEWCAVPRDDLDNEYLIINYIVPGSPGVQVVMYFRASDEARDAIRHGQSPSDTADPMSTPNARQAKRTTWDDLTGWKRTVNRFWKADKSFCDARFKVIPCMDKKAPWAVRMAVGEKPALVGKKLQQYYFRGPNYFEVDMDISSSSTAARILSLVRSMSTSLIVDVGVTIEATSQEELPERMLCQCRLWGLDFENALPHPAHRSSSITSS